MKAENINPLIKRRRPFSRGKNSFGREKLKQRRKAVQTSPTKTTVVAIESSPSALYALRPQISNPNRDILAPGPPSTASFIASAEPTPTHSNFSITELFAPSYQTVCIPTFFIYAPFSFRSVSVYPRLFTRLPCQLHCDNNELTSPSRCYHQSWSHHYDPTLPQPILRASIDPTFFNTESTIFKSSSWSK